MDRYMRIKTTTGHKYNLRMAEDERAARIMYRVALVIVPFISSAVMFLIWVKVG